MNADELRAALMRIQRWETERAWCDSDDLDNAEDQLEEAFRALAELLRGDQDGTLPGLPAALYL